MRTVTVLVPTLCEQDNIDPLLEHIFQVRAKGVTWFDILFIDSASTDRTCERIRCWIPRGGVALLSLAANVGLAGAVLMGAAHVDTDCVVVMDCDLSHPPERIPDLVAPVIAEEVDMVIGSRYVEGGGTPDWPWQRRLSSRLATLPARCFCSVKDPLAGFFAVRRQLLLDLPGEVPGFKIGLAVLAHYGKALRVKEVPIQFRDRNLGQSKMRFGVVLDYARQLQQIGLARLGRRIRTG